MRRFGRYGLAASVLGLACLAFPSVHLHAQSDDADAVADSPLATQPETPSERIRAALLLLKLTRPDLAKEQIDAVVSANLSSTELLELRNAYGTGTFLRIARNQDLQPGGSELLEQLTAAARSQGSADGYLDELLNGLDGNRDDANASMREIKRLGPNGVIALLDRAGRDVATDLKLEKVLALLGDRAVGPLSDAIAVSRNDAIRRLAVRALSRTATAAQVPTLVAVVADANEPEELRRAAADGLDRLSASSFAFDASGTLRSAARDLLSGQERLVRDNNDQVLLFDVDPAAPAIGQQLTRRDVSETTARKILAMRALDAAVRIDPDDREALRLGYVLKLDAAAAGEAENELLRRGPDAAADVLAYALELNLAKPAVAALEVIGTVGRHDVFANLSPAARALDAPHQSVQFAAASAAVAVGPTTPFPNSPRVVEILAACLSGDADRKVVIVDPNSRRASDIGGRLRQIGFTPILAESGREGFRTAASRSDVALAIVHANSVDWELTPTVVNFEADARTAAIPVAIVASTQARDSFSWVKKQHPSLMYMPVQSDVNGIRTALKPAFAQLAETPLPTTSAKRAEAAALVRQIAERRMTAVFPIEQIADVLMESANDENVNIAVDVVTSLGFIANADVQTRLAEIATAFPEPTVRREAATALVRHLASFGTAVSQDVARSLAAADAGSDAQLRRSLSAAAGLMAR